jgi:hypothetical protein
LTALSTAFFGPQGDAYQVEIVGRLGAEHRAVGLVVAGCEHGIDERRQLSKFIEGGKPTLFKPRT